MTIGNPTPDLTPQERRKVRFGAARRVVIAADLFIVALIGLVMFAP
jgi:hypothetical protein